MKKVLKTFCLVLTAIIVISSFLTVFVINGAGGLLSFDFFGANEVVEDIKNYEMNMTSVIYVKNGGEWTEYQRIHGDENRIWVDIDKCPKQLLDAFIAIEDSKFYKHGGVDWKRTAGAFANLFLHFWEGEPGASTITQQLVKNVTADNDHSAKRKLREVARAIAVEKALDKQTILEAYLNTISLGNGICGVQVASNYYFNKDVSELSLVECAALAGITQNPSAFDPINNPDGNLSRRRTVLDRMLELNMIDTDEYNDAYESVLIIDPSQKSNYEAEVYSYFVDALIDDASEKLAKVYNCTVDEATMKIYHGGYKIYSTVDLEIQNIMEDVYEDVPTYFSQVSKKTGENVQSAMTVMDYEGHIVGIVGGAGEKTTSRGLNRATDSPRQPGSTMKPLGVYAPAIDNGSATYSSVLTDKPLKDYFGKGKDGPYEWYGYYAGAMSLQFAIEHSANTIPCWILNDSLGISNSYKFVTERIHLNHLTEVDNNTASLALGGCQYGVTATESAAAYAIFGNQGKYYEPTTFYKITDKNDKVVIESDTKGEQAIKPATAAIMNRLLQNVVYGANGTGGGIAGYSRMRAYAKTGTSDSSVDLWMVAGTPYYVGSVWYGFDQNETVYNAGAAAKVWRAVMSKVHNGLERKDFDLSEDVQKKTYCRYTGLLAGKNCGNVAIGYYVPDIKDKYCSGKHTVLPDGLGNSSSSSSSSSSQTSSSSSSTSSGDNSSDTSSSTTSENPPSPSESSSSTSSENTRP